MKNSPSPENVILETLSDMRPIVLLLGQDTWSIGCEPDPILKLSLKHLKRKEENINGWPSLINAEPLPKDFYQWLAERFTRRVPPEWMETILSFPWSAIFTSSIDPSIRDTFATQGRSPKVVLTGDEIPLVMRSRTRTPIYYLFGRAGFDDENSTPPSSIQSLRNRRNTHAIPMLNRVVETATAIGAIIIEGFSPACDWIQLDNILTIIDQMPDYQVIWFGWPEKHNIPELNEIEELAEKGKILITKARLSSLIAELNTSGRLSDATKDFLDESKDITFDKNRVFSPTPEMRIRVESVASIVDDSWLNFQPPLAIDSLYTLFRQFHGDTEGAKALVEGVRRDFAIERDFEGALWELVNKASQDHEKFNEPIIVHGQSGTGKSIALSRLVFGLKKIGRSAILYSISRIPQSTDVSEFCEMAEHQGAMSTVIVCDSNAYIGRYRELLQQLRSRGRKVVVVGSSYRQIEGAVHRSKYLIEAPNTLSKSEVVALSKLINIFGVIASPESISESSNVLAAIYRMLPASRVKFASGLGREAQVVEGELRERGSIKQKKDISSPLAEKLIKLGLAKSESPLLDQCMEDMLENIEDSAGRLIDLVMAPGRINCPVPINLLLRAISSGQYPIDFNIVSQMFKEIDLFRWRGSEQEGEELLISPRLQLEAELICRRRLGNREMQGKRLVELMKATRLSWDAGGTERRFLLDLLHKFGPDGPQSDFYKDSYLLAAKALTDLREQYGSVPDPSIMLQESVLRRAAIRLDVIEDNKQYQVLEEAREAVQLAIDHLYKNRSNQHQRMMNNLMVERASIYGFMARNCLKNKGSNEDIWSAYNAARTVAQAAANTIDTYYPLDISLWVPADLLETDSLTEEQKSELRADIHSVLDRIDGDNLDPEQRNQFEKRRFKLGTLLNLPDLSDEAFKGLEKIGSVAGYFLRARSFGPEVGYNSSKELTSEEIAKAEKVVNYFMNYWQKINVDPRCLRYLLQCKWIATTHRYFLKDERAPLPFEDEQRRIILQILQALITTLGETCDFALRYLEAVITWLLGGDSEAKALWLRLSKDSDNNDPRRVYKHHILTNTDGSAQIFSGRVEKEESQGRFIINVRGLNRRISIRKVDFPEYEIAYGRSIEGFAIGFNYIGPIADPLKRVRGQN